jgi:hypothetical protein
MREGLILFTSIAVASLSVLKNYLLTRKIKKQLPDNVRKIYLEIKWNLNIEYFINLNGRKGLDSGI